MTLSQFTRTPYFFAYAYSHHQRRMMPLLSFKIHAQRPSVAIEIYFLSRAFIYVPPLCVRAAKALVRLCGFTGLSEPSLLANAISTNIS